MNTVAKRRNNPVRLEMFNDIDNIVNGFFKPHRVVDDNGNAVMSLAIDVVEKDSVYEIQAEMPGVNMDDLEITLNDGVLTISAETKADELEESEGKVVRRERRYGKYSRSMKLGKNVDENNIEANYKDGVLTLSLAKAEEIQPRKIAVNV